MSRGEKRSRPSERVPLEQIDDYSWRIPKKYKPGMRVPGIVFADKNLLEKMRTDRTLWQCANVAHLPGIYKYAITLPDGHEGYGFPIGGVAATDYDEGVISPGGVGYDINCLSGKTRILTSHGYWMEIEDMENMDRKLVSIDLNDHRTVSASIVRYIKIRRRNKVYRITTETEREIIATEDHPFLTPKGMAPLRDLCKGDHVAVYPFEGVRYEKPGDETVLTEEEVGVLLLCKKNAVIRELKKRDVLPLRMSDPRIPTLAGLVGYVLGDGTIYFTNGKGVTWFYGRPEDLEEIRVSIESLGYTPSKVYERTRKHEITNQYGTKTFTATSYSIKVVANSFAALLVALGVPIGDKTKANFGVPSWLKEAPLWIKRMFLASLFGAELTKPKKIQKFNFYCPILAINKTEGFVRGGHRFLEQVAHLLGEFGVRATRISEREEFINKEGNKTVRLRLLLSSQPENLISLWGRVGFKYNRKRSHLAGLAVHYLKLKERVIKTRIDAVKRARKLKMPHKGLSEIYRVLESERVNKRFLERWVYREDYPNPRVPQNFPAYEEFVKTHTLNPQNSGIVWDKIKTKEKINFEDIVYDFTVSFKDHNFIANGFVVSNCGVRLLTTNLSEQDIRPKLAQLTNAIFNNVPCGLGSRRKDFRVTIHELERLLTEGVQWAVDRGLGWSEDAKHHEEQGCMENANPDKVSTRAKNRGLTQVGTLGSGNHFLEIQKVDKICDAKTAKVFGIEHEGQVTAMIHCGSRGFGHQVCSDYLRVMEGAVHKYNIALPDRELACAPGNSKEAEDYYQAMACAVNYAFVNRQTIMHWVRQSFQQVFKEDPEKFGLNLVYDVTHNIAKIETHEVDGERKKVWVHRKGATRAFPPGHPDVPADYRAVGQPVLIPGSMGTSSWLLVGTEKAMHITFGSTAHGAGRMMSRTAAKRRFWGGDVKKALEKRGIFVRAASAVVLAEEADPAYKDVDRVAEVSDRLGIATRVARLVPLAVVKG